VTETKLSIRAGGINTYQAVPINRFHLCVLCISDYEILSLPSEIISSFSWNVLQNISSEGTWTQSPHPLVHMMLLFLFSSLALAGLVAADLPCTPLVNGSLAIQADTNDTLPQSMLSVGPWNGIYYPLQYIGGNETFTFQNCSSTFIGIGPSSDPGEDFYYG
jgi:hypothetical protein